MRPLYWLLPYLLHTLALPIEPPHINNSLQSNAILRRLSLNPDYTILPREEPPLGQNKQGTSILKDTNRPVDHDPNNKGKPKKTVRFASSPQVKEITPFHDSDDSSDRTASPPPPIDHSKIPISQRRSRPSDHTPPTLHRSKVDRYKLSPNGKPSSFFGGNDPDPKD